MKNPNIRIQIWKNKQLQPHMHHFLSILQSLLGQHEATIGTTLLWFWNPCANCNFLWLNSICSQHSLQCRHQYFWSAENVKKGWKSLKSACVNPEDCLEFEQLTAFINWSVGVKRFTTTTQVMLSLLWMITHTYKLWLPSLSLFLFFSLFLYHSMIQVLTLPRVWRIVVVFQNFPATYIVDID